MKTDELVQRLVYSLQKLTSLLRLDPECQWVSKFESDLAACQELRVKSYSKSDLAALSNSITHVFQGMGSFNDYAPGRYDPKSGRYSAIPGTENYELVSREVYDLARKLIESDKT